MKKKFIILLIASLSAFASERDPRIEHDPALELEPQDFANAAVAVAKRLRRIEVFYNYAGNADVLHELGVKAQFAIDECDRNFERVGTFTCDMDQVQYVRAGVIDFTGMHLRNPDGTSSTFQLQNASLKLSEKMTKDGFYLAIMKVEYIKNNRSKFIDFQLPLTMVTMAQNLHIKLDKKGVARIYIQGHIEGGVQFTSYNQIFAGDNDKKTRIASSWPFLAAGAEAGLKIGSRFHIGAVLQGRWDKLEGTGLVDEKKYSSYEYEYGIKSNLKLTKQLSIGADGFILNRNVPNKVLAPVKSEGVMPGASQERYWYVGGNVEVKF